MHPAIRAFLHSASFNRLYLFSSAFTSPPPKASYCFSDKAKVVTKPEPEGVEDLDDPLPSRTYPAEPSLQLKSNRCAATVLFTG
jgi:hypothetical protein